MRKRLIVMEGLDGSGKATQTKLLCQWLQELHLPCRAISFPNYQAPSSALVKLYLSGALGSNPGDVNPYAAASFYAVDRFASYQSDWKSNYEAGEVILADRYVTSNMIYQLSKVPEGEKAQFLAWVQSYEYEKLGLPKPDVTLYLDMEPRISQRLMAERYQGDESKKDIHECNVSFLEECRHSALYSAEQLHWQRISCYTGDAPKPIPVIQAEIQSVLRPYLLAT